MAVEISSGTGVVWHRRDMYTSVQTINKLIYGHTWEVQRGQRLLLLETEDG